MVIEVAMAELAREQQMNVEKFQVTLVIWSLHAVSTSPSSCTVPWA